MPVRILPVPMETNVLRLVVSKPALVNRTRIAPKGTVVSWSVKSMDIATPVLVVHVKEHPNLAVTECAKVAKIALLVLGIVPVLPTNNVKKVFVPRFHLHQIDVGTVAVKPVARKIVAPVRATVPVLPTRIVIEGFVKKPISVPMER